MAYGGGLTATDHGTVALDTALDALNGVTITVDATGILPIDQFTAVTGAGGGISVDGGSFTLTNLSDIDNASFDVEGGGTLNLPAAISYTCTSGYGEFRATDTSAGGVLSLPNLATLGGAEGEIFEAWGTRSVIELSPLTVFSGGGPAISIISGGQIVDTSSTSTSGPANTLEVQEELSSQGTSAISLDGSLEVDGSGILSLSPSATLDIRGNLLGDTTNADDYDPLGTVAFDGGAGAGSPQLLEAMSEDLGAVPSGFEDNFAYVTISVSANTYLRLVDHSHNSIGTGAEAVYANGLIVPSGGTLDLNGLHMYVRGEEIGGVVLNGTVTLLPGGGPIQVGIATAGVVSAGAVDDWTFFGRSGETVSIAVNPGSGGSPGALSPQLGWASVELLSPDGEVVVSGSNASNGSIVNLSGVTIAADGTYTIQVEAPTSHSTADGNYLFTLDDNTAQVYQLLPDQQENGALIGPFGVDQWAFSATADEEVQFDLVNASPGAEDFSLSGPDGYVAFANLQGSSGPVTLPAAGEYVLSVAGTGDNEGGYAFRLEELSVVDLSLGTIRPESLPGSGNAQLFEVNVTTGGQTLFLSLKDSTSGDVNQLFAQLGTPPTPAAFAFASTGPSPDPQILVPSAAAGTWYVLAYTESAAGPSDYTIVATGAPVRLSGVIPGSSAAGSTATLTLTGAGFDQATSVALVPAVGPTTAYDASSVSLDTFTQLTATFDLSQVPEGLYSVIVTRADGTTSELTAAFTVTVPATGHLVTDLILPAVMGRHISSTIYVQYSNTGGQAIPAPLLVLYAPPEMADGEMITNLPLLTMNPALQVSGYWTSSLPVGYSNTAEILASGTEVPGWLEPGESVTVPVYYAGMQQPWSFAETGFDFALQVYTQTDRTTLNWSSLRSSLEPSVISTAAWDAVFPGLTAQLGDTWGGYVQMLDNNAAYLGQLGEDVTDVDQIWQFAIMQADGLSPVSVLDDETDISVASAGMALDFTRAMANSIVARNTFGPFGYGWTNNWQYSLSVASDSTVTVTMPSGVERIFQPDSRGADYFAEPGDEGILAQGAGGTFLLQESDGTIEAFNANGTLNYIQDTNGNRITAGYTGGQLTSLTSSSGGSLTIAYNAAGLIQSVTTSDGRTVSYGYDPTDHYLVSVQGYSGGTTLYEYITGPNLALANALTAIAFPDGTQEDFTYDSIGQLASMSLGDGTGQLGFSYSGGEVIVTDAADDVSSYYYDDEGDLVKYVDPLGNVYFGTYNSVGQITSVTGPTGLEESFTYDGNGNLVSETNPLDQTTNFTYTGPDNLLASMTNPQGYKTNYQYNTSGDLTSIQYPDDSVQTTTYDALGDPLSLTQQNGQANDSTYNAAGQVTSVTLSDGTQMTYAYNAAGELTSATDPSGTTTLTYDTAGDLIGVSYPNGTSLQYTYSDGQRIQMVEMSGSTVVGTVNYTYTDAGQLAGLNDGNGNLIVSYTYNVLGELTEEDKGDGTYTTYQYDADGNLIDLTNYGAGGAVDSSFQYTYDALGQVSTEVTSDGTWSYTYDSLGELTGAVFASTNASIPSQNLNYVYNAEGDRTQTIINGATSTYTSNSLNEYTTITSSNGTTTHTYNANGDLISETDSSGTTTYTYDSLNRLTGVTSSGGTWTYQYDALGNVIATTYNGQTTENLVDPTGLGDVLAQLDSSGNLVAGYTYGLGLVSQTTPSATNFYEFDALGSTAGLTTAGSPPGTSSLIASYNYLPFGSLISSTGSTANPFTFAGQVGVSTDGSGLHTIGDRSYDPTTGQFTSNDPLGIAGGSSNLRMYVGNNPTNGLDPTGLAGPTALDQASVISGAYGSTANSVEELGVGESGSLAQAQSAVSTASGGLGAALGVPGLASATADAIEVPTPDSERAAALDELSFDLGTSALLLGGAGLGPYGAVATAGSLAPGLYSVETTAHATSAQPSTTNYLDGSVAETVVLPSPSQQSVAPGTPAATSGPLTTTGALPGAPGAAGTAVSESGSVPGGITESGNTQAGGPAGKRGLTALPGEPGPSGSGGYSGSAGTSGQSGISGINGSGSAKSAHSYDPNAKIGPLGYGADNYVSGSALTLFPYQIDFENSPTATAPAQQVTITDQLDSNLDLSTFQLTQIAFGDTVIPIAPGTQQFQTTVPMTYNGETFDVAISAGLNYALGQVYARFESIDPATQLPPDVLTGFLPPENGTGRGQGSISYVISPKAGLPNGTQIRNVAAITFDANPPISTDQISDTDPGEGVDPSKQDLITLVTAPPASSVAPLPASQDTPSFPVSWSGQDPGGPGIASYSVWVSIDGRGYKEWLASTTLTSDAYTALPGVHTYAFYSVATDFVGNVQAVPSAPQATTDDQVLPPARPAPPTLLPADDSGTKGDDITDGAQPDFFGTTQPGASVELLIGSNVLGRTTANAGGSYLIALESALAPGVYEITAVASNAEGASPASDQLTLTIVAPPATPAAPTLLPAENLGGETTSSPSPELVGTAIPGATIQLLATGGAVLQTAVASATGAYEIQVRGPLAVGAHAYEVDVIDRYGDVSSPSPALTITVVNPLPLVTVDSVRVEKSKIGKGKKAKNETVLVLQFSGALDPASAQNTQAYVLALDPRSRLRGRASTRSLTTSKLGALQYAARKARVW